MTICCRRRCCCEQVTLLQLLWGDDDDNDDGADECCRCRLNVTSRQPFTARRRARVDVDELITTRRIRIHLTSSSAPAPTATFYSQPRCQNLASTRSDEQEKGRRRLVPERVCAAVAKYRRWSADVRRSSKLSAARHFNNGTRKPKLHLLLRICCKPTIRCATSRKFTANPPQQKRKNRRPATNSQHLVMSCGLSLSYDLLSSRSTTSRSSGVWPLTPATRTTRLGRDELAACHGVAQSYTCDETHCINHFARLRPFAFIRVYTFVCVAALTQALCLRLRLQ